MKIVKVIIALMCALGADIFFNKLFSFMNPFFDPYMILIVYFGTISKPVSSLFIGTAAGLVEDTWRELIFGLNGFKKTLIGYLIAVLASIFDLTGILARCAILIVATLLDFLLEAGFMVLLGKGVDASIFYTMGGRIVGNLILGMFFFIVMAKLSKRRYAEAS